MNYTAQVIPAVLEKDFDEIIKKIELIRPYTDIIQLDVMDGAFVPNTTFNDTFKLATLDINMELHLMIEKPAFYISKWAMANVKRMIVHYEAASNIGHVIDLIERAEKEVGVALNAETPSHVLEDHIDRIDMVLIMGVHPGFSGQDFIRDVLEKIREIKKMRPGVLVAVDGGVNMRTRKSILEAGADILSANSAIWKADDIGQAMKVMTEGPQPQ